ncbi:methyltransferase domain-containing protein [Nostoc sp. CHAB 5784]|uniref:methyltransferase domain-containing protein n=1 Tax=Nostoc mirabile TaxID=2907820 RepID=UPI001E4A77E1|nr:methyltransferase domain-containing protein [Nostoc mirabile]MCC5665335.1 methyltransferase domain-containing protein [Nostoc mirabile CHAB5784]
MKIEELNWQKQAQEFLLKGQYDQIVSFYEQAIQTEPDNIIHYCYLGLAYLLQDRPEEAQATWVLATMAQEDPEEAEWTEKLIEILDKEAQRQATLTNFQKSWIIRQQIQEIDPSFVFDTNLECYQNKTNILDQLIQPYKLNFGCGKVKFDGWLNIDIDTTLNTVDLIWDVSNRLPFKDNSCQIIYHEHMLEHLPVEQGIFFLHECYRVLQVGGVLRVAMPSLDVLLKKATSENWRDQDWLRWPEYQFIQTRAEMINIAFRWWGHQYLYDSEELHRRLHEAGFIYVKDVEWGCSDTKELRNRETRNDSLLICEARK